MWANAGAAAGAGANAAAGASAGARAAGGGGGAWAPLVRKGSFGHKSFEDKQRHQAQLEESSGGSSSSSSSVGKSAVLPSGLVPQSVSPSSPPPAACLPPPPPAPHSIVDRTSRPAVVIVDPFSSGALLASSALKLGYHVIRVLSERNSPVASLVSDDVRTTQYDATVQHDDGTRIKAFEEEEEENEEEGQDAGGATEPATRSDDERVASTIGQIQLLPWKIVAVLAGAETGVLLADKLAARMTECTDKDDLSQRPLRGNGESLSLARRNKYVMGETVRSAGVRAVTQSIETSWSGVSRFLDSWNPIPFKVIVKPNQSAGSDDVFLCNDVEQVRRAFDKIDGAINGLGVRNEGVLVQEFLEGKEYVVDSVSRDGVHKIMAIWEYDKRHVNEQFNVYFGMKLMCVNDEMTETLVSYQRSVLDAVGLSQGPAHAEIMLTPTGPCLVEVGSRCHGGEGTWQPLCDACIGYNQIDVTLDAFLDGGRFDALPDVPRSMNKAGREAFVVARQSGVLRAIPGIGVVRKLASFLREEVMVRPPTFMPRTVDCFTRPASFQLLHADESVVEADYQRIRDLESSGAMWDFSVLCKTRPESGAVVVVDPFSSGAQLAAKVISQGYHLVMVFSEVDSPVASLVAKGTVLTGPVV